MPCVCSERSEPIYPYFKSRTFFVAPVMGTSAMHQFKIQGRTCNGYLSYFRSGGSPSPWDRGQPVHGGRGVDVERHHRLRGICKLERTLLKVTRPGFVRSPWADFFSWRLIKLVVENYSCKNVLGWRSFVIFTTLVILSKSMKRHNMKYN